MAEVDEVASADWQEERLYKPFPGEAQLTARAVLAGCLIGSVVSCTNYLHWSENWLVVWCLHHHSRAGFCTVCGDRQAT